MGVKFITLRRRGKKLLDYIKHLKPWKRIHIPHAKRKYPNPLVHESIVEMDNYKGRLRQIMENPMGNCDKCTFRAKYDKSPKSFLGRLWKWHIRWCPGWKSHLKSQSQEKREALLKQYQ